MTLTNSEIMRAAEIAARKFGSNDPAIEHDDFVQLAAIRIIDRNPTTIGTAVKVGREAIGKVISYARYKKESAANTARGVDVDRPGRVTKIGRLPNPERKKRRHAQEIIRIIGRPIRRFGKFGVAYPAAVEPKLATVYFDPIENLQGSRRRRLLIKASRVTPAIRKLADSHYVLLLVTNGKKENTACLAGCKR